METCHSGWIVIDGILLRILVWWSCSRILRGLVVVCQLFQHSNRKRFVLRNLLSGVIAIGTSILLAHNMLIALWNGDNNYEQLTTPPVAYLGWFDLPFMTAFRFMARPI